MEEQFYTITKHPARSASRPVSTRPAASRRASARCTGTAAPTPISVRA
jgi:hypothetical protein